MSKAICPFTVTTSVVGVCLVLPLPALPSEPLRQQVPALLGALGEELEASLPKQGVLLSCESHCRGVFANETGRVLKWGRGSVLVSTAAGKSQSTPSHDLSSARQW